MFASEIIVIIIGLLLYVVTFFLPERKEQVEVMNQDLIQEMIEKKLEIEYAAFRDKAEEIIDELVVYSSDKTERVLERLSNEKIQSIDEFSNTVLKEIHKNHEETMFLYDMLVQKEKVLKHTRTMPTIQSLRPSEEEPQEVIAEEQVEEFVEQIVPVETEKKHVVQVETSDYMEENNNQKILSMHEEGHSIETIAKQLGLGIGEVKLVVGLFQ